jgi:TPR repeat protein
MRTVRLARSSPAVVLIVASAVGAGGGGGAGGAGSGGGAGGAGGGGGVTQELLYRATPNWMSPLEVIPGRRVSCRVCSCVAHPARSLYRTGVATERAKPRILRERAWWSRTEEAVARGGDALAAHTLGRIHHNRGDPMEADRYERMAAQRGDVRAAYDLARILLEQERRDEAIIWLRLAAIDGRRRAASRSWRLTTWR